MRRDIETRYAVETNADILEELRLVRMHLESDEEESLRFRISRPLTRVSPFVDASATGLGGSLGTTSIPSKSREPPLEEINMSHVSHTTWRESALTRSIVKKSATFTLRSIRKFSSSYHSAGLSDDCRHVFANNDSEISVYQLGDLRGESALPDFSRVFTQQYKHGECIRHIASSQRYIVIITNKRLLVFNLDATTPFDTTLHGNWDPSGLACHESETHLVVFLGQCQRNKANKYNGQIRVYRYSIDGQAKKLPLFTLSVPANDCPKRLSFDTNSQILTCITRIQNKLLVWKLDDDFLSLLEPFEFLKNKYTAVSVQRLTTPADKH